MYWRSALRFSTKIFAAILLITLAFSFIATAIGAETPLLESSILTFFILLLEPAVRLKQFMHPIQGGDEGYHYYGLLNSFDYVALFLFYFALCIVMAMAWQVPRGKGRKKS